MIGRYNKIKIGNNWLSDDGTAATDEAATQIVNLHRFKGKKTGRTFLALDGTATTQLKSWRGEIIEIQSEKLRVDIYNRVVYLINDYLDTGDRLDLLVEGSDRDYEFVVEPFLPNPHTEADETYGDLENVVFKFIVYELMAERE